MIIEQPFPYIVIDDCLPSATFDRLADHWPRDDLFGSDYPEGDISSCSIQNLDAQGLLDETDATYWNDALQSVSAAVSSTAELFSPFVEARFGVSSDATEQLPQTLMQHGPGFEHHGAHTHFYRDPHFVVTCLLYVDDAGSESRGTSMFADTSARSVFDTATSASRFGEASWDKMDRIEEVEIIRFRPNRMFAFFETPHAWHGVGPFERVNNGGKRRIIRSIVQMPESEVVRVYGTDIEGFRARYTNGPNSSENIVSIASELKRVQSVTPAKTDGPEGT